MRPIAVVQTVLVLGLVAAMGTEKAAGRNIAVDAVSRATTYNSHEGELVVLTDGMVPGIDEMAPAFRWNTSGILVFEWSKPLPVTHVRVYVGEIGTDYVIRTFVGGRLNSAGTLRDPEGVLTANVEEHSRATNGWIETVLPENTIADNIELVALGPIVLHEVEIQVRVSETAVQDMGWSDLKARYEDGSRKAQFRGGRVGW